NMSYKIQQPITPRDLCHIETISPNPDGNTIDYTEHFTGFEETNRDEAQALLKADPQEPVIDPDQTLFEIPAAPVKLSAKEQQVEQITTAVTKLDKLLEILKTKGELAQSLYENMPELGHNNNFRYANFTYMVDALKHVYNGLESSQYGLDEFYQALDRLKFKHHYLRDGLGSNGISKSITVLEGIQKIQETIKPAKTLVDLFEAHKEQTFADLIV
ncbi:MAG: hypothetical protein O3C63_03420, partial [Cyanobacteria bacterium]|nr:hypothetical protein [Cyanobacteriota bacterium]